LSAEGNALYIGFLAEKPAKEVKEKLLAFITEVDDFHLSGREVFWLCRKHIGESEFSGARLERSFRMQATFRNSTTVRKIAAKYS
jgi:uncharacterized protein (DUF1697 family)